MICGQVLKFVAAAFADNVRGTIRYILGQCTAEQWASIVKATAELDALDPDRVNAELRGKYLRKLVELGVGAMVVSKGSGNLMSRLEHLLLVSAVDMEAVKEEARGRQVLARVACACQ